MNSSLGSLLFLNSDFSLGVGDSDSQLSSSLNDGSLLSSRDGSSNLSSVSGVVHQKDIKLLKVSNLEFLESGWQQVSGGLVRSVSDLSHGSSSSESSSGGVINTSGSSPRRAELSSEVVAFASGEFLYSLLDNFLVSQSFDGHF